ncbi:MAG: hypothetical protein GY757_16435 [bacterium]|nr:hypothetical protein [bacterium]
MFHSYTYMLRFKARLSSGDQPGTYVVSMPAKIETYDQRKYARLVFESKENKIITVYNKDLKHSIKAILSDISAGGMKFFVIDPNLIPKPGELVVADIQLMGKQIKSFARVVQVHDENVGCSFLDKSNQFQLDLNKIINKEIQWRSEIMLKNLNKREELMGQVRNTRLLSDTKDKENKEILAAKLEALEPVSDFFISRIESITGLLMEKRSISFKEHTFCNFTVSLYFKLDYNEVIFKCFFYTRSSSLYKLAQKFMKEQDGGTVVNAENILDTLGKKMLAKSLRQGPDESPYKTSPASVVQSNKRLLFSLEKHPSINMTFDSPIGEFHLVLMADNLEAIIEKFASTKIFVTMDKMDLIEPISYATLDVFSNYLNLDIKEKSIVSRERLLPRFEISILLDICFKESEGKVVLNMSKKLALKIYEILVKEKADDFNDDVKDAVSELTNMITGNAKNEYEKNGIYYKLSTPIVIDCKDQAIIYSKNITFLSSVYWTSEGFFELSFSVFKT